MGHAKTLWMEEQEIAPMVEWIEENYGDDAGERGSPEWEAAVAQYHEFCDRVEHANMLDNWREEYYYYISITLSDADENFDRDMTDLTRMVSVAGPLAESPTFHRMLIAQAVTVLEVYLESIVKSLILASPKHLENTIKNVKPFCDTAYKLSELSLEPTGIQQFVVGKMSENLFHDPIKALNILRGIVGIKLQVPLNEICRVTAMRHDIVHRNGKDKGGQPIEINQQVATNAASTVRQFVNDIRRELSKMPE